MATFVQILVFNKKFGDQLIKESSFIDKKGKTVDVNMTFKWVMPGFRYFCKIESALKGKEFVYEIISAHMFCDDLRIKTLDGKVCVTLNDEIVPKLTFDPNINAVYDYRLADLQAKFDDKEFQLANSGDIKTFLSEYESQCKKLYDETMKEVKSSTKKSKFKTKIIITK